MTSIPTTLKRLRAASGLTQKQVAAAVGWSVSQINEVENGRAQPSYDLLTRLCEVYGATLVIVPTPTEAGTAAWQEAPEVVTFLALAGVRLYRALIRQSGSYAEHFAAMNDAADAIGALLGQIETKE